MQRVHGIVSEVLPAIEDMQIFSPRGNHFAGLPSKGDGRRANLAIRSPILQSFGTWYFLAKNGQKSVVKTHFKK